MTPPGLYVGLLVVRFMRLALKIEPDFFLFYSIRKTGKKKN